VPHHTGQRIELVDLHIFQDKFCRHNDFLAVLDYLEAAIFITVRVFHYVHNGHDQSVKQTRIDFLGQFDVEPLENRLPNIKTGKIFDSLGMTQKHIGFPENLVDRVHVVLFFEHALLELPDKRLIVVSVNFDLGFGHHAKA
jgi:hypothetical protein